MAGVDANPTLALGPVVGGVTATEAKVFIRTDRAARVAVRFSVRSDFKGFRKSETFVTDATSDFTKVISLTGLAAEKTYYLDVLVNGVPQLASPYPSFNTFPPVGSPRNFRFVVLTDLRQSDT